MKKKYQGSEQHIENAKKAGEKGRLKKTLQKEERIKKYNSNPIKCLNCNNPIPYKKRNENKYCNHKCRASKVNPTKGTERNDETRKKISLSLGGNGELSESKRKYKCKPKTDEEKLMTESELKSKRMKEYYENNPEARKKISEFAKNRITTDETKKKLKELMRIRIEN